MGKSRAFFPSFLMCFDFSSNSFYLFRFVCISLSHTQILFSGLALLLCISSAVSIEYFPHNHHADSAAGHLKYIEPAHVKSIKYVQQAPILKQYAIAPAPPLPPVHAHPIKYIDDNHHQHHHHSHYPKHVDYHDDEPAHYEYGYDVQDHQTGDFKSHSEKRDGHNVQGRYEVLDPDG